MAVSYKKLWKLLIDKDIKKKDLSAMSGVSPATITKMGKNGHVTTEVLLKICVALECGIDDIVENPDTTAQVTETIPSPPPTTEEIAPDTEVAE